MRAHGAGSPDNKSYDESVWATHTGCVRVELLTSVFLPASMPSHSI